MSWTLHDKTIVITGATSGIGKEAARMLARMGAEIVLIARDRNKAQSVVDELLVDHPAGRLRIFLADLSLLRDVRRVAEEIKNAHPRIHVLMNNAGVFLASRHLTDEGFEKTFAVNHLAPFLLTRLLWPALEAAAPARVINVTSVGHKLCRFDLKNLQGEKSYSATNAYGLSKLAVISSTLALAKMGEAPGITVNSVHPGAIGTNFAQDDGGLLGLGMRIGKIFLRSPQSGALPLVHLASAAEVSGISGRYFNRLKPGKPSAASSTPEAVRGIWTASCAWAQLPEAPLSS